jgi:hypothetical protein
MRNVNAVPTPTLPLVDKPWRTFTRGERILLWLITWAGYLAIRILGPTIRFSVSWEEGSPRSLAQRPFVYSFWHNCMIPAMYWCRDLKVRVMSSDSFDGEYTGRIMQKFGFVKVRGSSSKGAVRALLGMRRELEQGWTVAFTIDGHLVARDRRAHGGLSHRYRSRLGSEYLGPMPDPEAVLPRPDAGEPRYRGSRGQQSGPLSTGAASRA